MRVEIHELWFEKDELTEGTFENEAKRQEHIARHGEEYCRYMQMFSKDGVRSVCFPTFFFDADGEVIPSRKTKEIPSVEPKIEWIMKMAFDLVMRDKDYSENDRIMKRMWGIEPKKVERIDKIIYVYICYRKDIPNSVGMCAHHEVLYKKGNL